MAAEVRKFKRHMDSLARIFEFVGEFSGREHVDAETKHAFELAVDELFTNTVRHQPRSTTDLSISLETNGDTMVLCITDPDADPFDPTKKPDPDLTGSLKERTPGGLGIYLTKKVVDEVQYQYHDRTSVTTLTKRFRRKDV